MESTETEWMSERVKMKNFVYCWQVYWAGTLDNLQHWKHNSIFVVDQKDSSKSLGIETLDNLQRKRELWGGY